MRNPAHLQRRNKALIARIEEIRENIGTNIKISILCAAHEYLLSPRTAKDIYYKAKSIDNKKKKINK